MPWSISFSMRRRLSTAVRQYDAFNSVRGHLHRLNRARKQRIIADSALLASVHWTREDAENFFNWKFLDERVYTPEAMQALLDQAPPPQLSLGGFLDLVARRLPEPPTTPASAGTAAPRRRDRAL